MSDNQLKVADRIAAKLVQAFDPTSLSVVDDSASHRGHAGAPDGGQSHFNVRIRAEIFAGMSRLARHRAVHAAIGPEIIAEIHALAIDADA